MEQNIVLALGPAGVTAGLLGLLKMTGDWSKWWKMLGAFCIAALITIGIKWGTGEVLTARLLVIPILNTWLLAMGMHAGQKAVTTSWKSRAVRD